MARFFDWELSRNPSRLGPPQPKPATLTFSPVFPSVVYSIGLTAIWFKPFQTFKKFKP